MASNEKWNRLEDKAFSFITIPPRVAKPRERGITVVADKGLGMGQAEDLFDLVGEYIDWIKIGISAPRIFTKKQLIDKINLCHKYDVKAFIAGDVTEMAIMQGVMDQYLEEVKELGADGVEIATAQIYMPLEEKCAIIKKAVEMGFQVFGEAGKKGVEGWAVAPNYVIKEVGALLEAGSYKVIIQGEGVLENVPEIDSKPLYELAAKFNVNDLVFQAKDNRAHTWLIKNFGLEVNMDIESNQVVIVELCRRGIRKRGLFSLIGSYKG
ncbi:MAG: phosphosulfolactate synthase [Desulfotomaculaceae bacterium]